jgi:hypothetical protein
MANIPTTTRVSQSLRKKLLLPATLPILREVTEVHLCGTGRGGSREAGVFVRGPDGLPGMGTTSPDLSFPYRVI